MNTRPTSIAETAQTILLLGNYRPTLILARVLARRGFRIISGLQGCDGGAEYSRFVDKIWDHPPIESAPGQFIDELGRFIRTNNVSVVFPVSEEFVVFFTRYPAANHIGAATAIMEPQLVERCLDKVSMMELARKNGVPTAPFAIVHNQRQLGYRTKNIGYPLVIRPEESTKRLAGKKAMFVADKAGLHAQLPHWPDGHSGLIVQKKADGKRHNIYFAACQGELFRYLHAVILRTDNPDGSGLAVEGVTIDPMPELRRYTETLIRALDYTGVGCAQYLVDEDSGSVSFLEINSRIAGNHAVPENAGLDLSSVLVDMALGRDLNTAPRTTKTGRRYVWTCGDIQAAKSAWSNSEIDNGTAAQWIMRAIGAALRADFHMTFALTDPKPGLIALKKLAPKWRKLATRLGRPAQRNASTETIQPN